jgi:dihydroxyacetone kinase
MAASLRNRPSYSATDLVEAVTAARDAMVGLGHAEAGDKTVIDAFSPFVEMLSQEIAQGRAAAPALRASAVAATTAAAATAGLRPRKGRARPLADRSVGTPDPGAVSLALIATALADKAGVWASDFGRTGPE